ncbi:FAD-dependent oxidoreductase [Rossellomorea vietnamensis]|uniref:FAD-dependent oxidoreductase n=2 Tax=Rossellomorea TaxID=2837508 RepID=A0A5D4KKZ8_9BACI|nr:MULTISPECIES: FAD-dependent oxidoreductase [Rossellomorea]TYR76983.1 FAD-dependent oxidoreductase [Rossellomorea vietnamensis]TYS84198.1 FAD-dependent oxidoreductase [Rossellomorea aquimaris]
MNEQKIPKESYSYWRKAAEERGLPYDKLANKNLQVDVTIVGAGITGIIAAYLLSREGKKVALVESGKVISGTTGYTTAKISTQHGLMYGDLIKHHGEEKAALYYQANDEAMMFLRSLTEELCISCEFTTQPSYVYAQTDKGSDQINKEAEAYKKLNIPGELTTETELPFEVKNALKLNNQAQFHPVKFLLPLLGEIKANGGLIFEHTRVTKVSGDSPVEVLTEDGGEITSEKVIVSTHFPINDFKGLYFSRLDIERSYILAAKTDSEIPDGMYLSADQPKRSLRYTTDSNGERMILFGGDSHKSGQGGDTTEHYENLKNFAVEHFAAKEFPYRWSAQDLTTLDQVPYIGPVTAHEKNTLVATGYAKWGMTNGTAAALLLTDYVLGRENRFEELFAPSRFNANPTVKNFIKENADVAKEFVKGKLDKNDRRLEELENGEGGVVTLDGKRAGAYRNDHGEVTVVDTTCTHMGCELGWNNAEKSWDCPCHGSRFSACGDVIEGPAVKPLKKIYD